MRASGWGSRGQNNAFKPLLKTSRIQPVESAGRLAIEVVMGEVVALALLGAMILVEALILWTFIRLFE